MRTRTCRAVVGLMAAVAAISLALPSVVHAHAQPDRSNPEADAVIPEAPERLEVWYTQTLFRREGANALEVTNEAGERVDLDDFEIDDDDRAHASVGLPADLPAGTYTVTWRTLSAVDGDDDEGTFAFTIDPTAPAPTPTPDEASPIPTVELTAAPDPTEATDPEPPASAAESDDEGTPIPWWALIAALGLLGSGVAAVWAVRQEVPSR